MVGKKECVHSDTAVGMHIYKPRDKAVPTRVIISDIYIVADRFFSVINQNGFKLSAYLGIINHHN